MNKKKTRFAVVLATLAICLTTFLTPLTTVQADDSFSVEAKAAIAVDAETGKILYDQDGETPMGIASVTKLLSLYIVLDQIKAGKLDWTDEVSISDYAEELSTVEDLSNVPLHSENKYTVKELFDASVIQSANAAIVALAEKIAGSEPKFVSMMRNQLKEFGITDATIVNASGLNNEYLGDNTYPGTDSDDENMMSAKDVAIISRRMILDYPEFLDVSSTTTEMFGEDTQSPVEMTNWNWMLPGFVNYKEGVDGLKTGTTEFAGACFAGTINKDGQRIITVVLNATNQEEDPSSRFSETARLMDYCYDNWSVKEVDETGATMTDLTSLDVKDGKEETVPVALDGKVKLWVRNDMDDEKITLTPTINKKKVTDNELTAPTTKGTDVGTATVHLTEDKLGYVDTDSEPTAKIVTTKSVEKANIFVIGWRGFTHFLGNIF